MTKNNIDSYLEIGRLTEEGRLINFINIIQVREVNLNEETGSYYLYRSPLSVIRCNGVGAHGGSG